MSEKVCPVCGQRYLDWSEFGGELFHIGAFADGDAVCSAACQKRYNEQREAEIASWSSGNG